jgi:mRNA interferase RelE/StbE
MLYRVEFKPPAERAFRGLPRAVQKRIRQHIDALGENPRPPGARKLAGSEDLWRIRVGDYRVVYTIRDDILLLLVVRVAHRREVYRG